MSEGPYRERPKLMLCPRCGEILDHAFDAVRVCMRCEGVWLGALSIQKAFGDRRWPDAQNIWWRNATPCPECAMEGESEIMNAAIIGQILIDRCYQHGLWLDRGELGRLMGGPLADDRGDDDLAALRERLEVMDSELENLLKRRDAWRVEAELRTKSGAEYRAWLAAEQQRRLAAERAIEAEKKPTEEQRQRAERERARRAADEARAAELARLEAEREKQAEQARRDEAEQQRQDERLRNAKRIEREQEIQRLGDVVAQASARTSRLEDEIRQLRDDLRDREADLARERARLRDAEQKQRTLEREDRADASRD